MYLNCYYCSRVTALVCDGASSNLTLLKKVMEKDGAFGYDKESKEDIHAIQAHFKNPFSGDHVFLIVCPTHQVHS